MFQYNHDIWWPDILFIYLTTVMTLLKQKWPLPRKYAVTELMQNNVVMCVFTVCLLILEAITPVIRLIPNISSQKPYFKCPNHLFSAVM